MSDEPPFDYGRAVFYMVALVLMVYMIVVLAHVSFCIYYGDDIVAGRFKCDPENRVRELLTAALAAAVAMIGTKWLSR